MVAQPVVLLGAGGQAVGDLLLHLFDALAGRERHRRPQGAADGHAAEPAGLAAGDLGDQDVGGAADDGLDAGVAHPRAAVAVQRVERGLDHYRLVQCADRQMRESRVARLTGVGCPSGHGDAQIELPAADRLDLLHAVTALGRVQIDRGVGRAAVLQRCGHTPRVALGGRAGGDDVPGRPQAGIDDDPDGLGHDGDAGEVVGHAPAVDPALGDGAGEGVVLPAVQAGDGLPVGVAEEDQAAPCAGAAQPRHDTDTVLRGRHIALGELVAHPHLGGRIAQRLDLAAGGAQVLGVALLHGGLAVTLGGDQALQELDAVRAPRLRGGDQGLRRVGHGGDAHVGWTPETRTSSRHFSRCERINAAKSCGEVG